MSYLDADGIRRACEVQRVGPTGLKVIADVSLETGETISASDHHKFKVHANEQ